MQIKTIFLAFQIILVTVVSYLHFYYYVNCLRIENYKLTCLIKVSVNKFRLVEHQMKLNIKGILSSSVCLLVAFKFPTTAWKVSVFEVILVRIFSHSDWIRNISPYSFQTWENTDLE